MNLKSKALFGMVATLAIAATLKAADITIGDGSSSFLITSSQTWTANNTYRLSGQVYVTSGATLTIEAGTKIQSDPNQKGSLAICRGSKIIANGTPTKPIIFTSTLDNLDTPVKHDGLNEWGNITIMGNAYIGASHKNATPDTAYTYNEGATNHTNSGTPDAMNKCVMEGLVNVGGNDPRVLYGGGNDNDDSGSISYVSLRYGGIVVSLTNELNGLSLGGVGRETDIHHIDIYDNVDDGIEIWGGTVNLKYLSIWNAGDDSFDIDQGWRGKAQFGLIVQGYATTGVAQGSGFSDNMIEIDGAERNDAQPVTTAVIQNFTCIGYNNPSKLGTDHAMAMRDGARVQFRNSVFIDVGEEILKEEVSEKDKTEGWRYGTNGIPTWQQEWQNTYDAAWNRSHAINALTSNHANVSSMSESALHALYAAQTDGNLCEITNCVFFNNYASGTTTYNQVMTWAGTATSNVFSAVSPIRSLTRETTPKTWSAVESGTTKTYVMQNVVSLDPRANPDVAYTAFTSSAPAPADGFFSPVPYRGAFSKDVNWALGWTAASSYGIMTATDTASAPPASAATLVTAVSFPTVPGAIYTVESSTDGKNWSPIRTVVGNGSVMAITESATDTTKVYRAIAQ